jgi:CHAD domain-containing protein
MRATERRRLVRGLRSARFERWRARWRTSLEEVATWEGEPSGSPAVPTVQEIGLERLAVAYRRVLRRGARITPASPADDVHDLRKRCKELRYLLEIFTPMLEPRGARSAVKELKTVQDVLGSFQDSEAQREAIYALATDMIARGDASAPTLLAMGEIAARLQESMQSSRSDVAATFERFARLSGQRWVARLRRPDPVQAERAAVAPAGAAR